MEPSRRDPDDRCPLCERPVAGDAPAPEYCDACGCLLVEWSPRDDADDAPPGVTRRTAAALAGGDVRDPYREPAAEPRLDLLVEHRQHRFGVATASAALFLVPVVMRAELPTGLTAGLAVFAIGVFAWSLTPRRAVMRFVATPDDLTVVGDGVPLHQGQQFKADEVACVLVRALARAERPEDRRLELVLVDRHGRHRSLLRGLDEPRTLAWLAFHIERALGFEESPDHR